MQEIDAMEVIFIMLLATFVMALWANRRRLLAGLVIGMFTLAAIAIAALIGCSAKKPVSRVPVPVALAARPKCPDGMDDIATVAIGPPTQETTGTLHIPFTDSTGARRYVVCAAPQRVRGGKPKEAVQ